MTSFDLLLPLGLVWLNEEGGVDRQASVPGWWTQGGMRVVGEDLLWVDDGKPKRQVRLGTSTLDEFVQLADAAPAQIRRYVERWGALGFCLDHRLPHALANPVRDSDDAPCRPTTIDEPYREPIEGYRLFAKQALALIKITAQIRRRELSGVDSTGWVRPHGASTLGVGYFAEPLPKVQAMAVARKSWEPLRSLFPAPLAAVFDRLTSVDHVATLTEEQCAVRHAIQTWMALGQVEVRWEWPPNRADPELSLGCSHLFGALALALALQTTSMAHVHVCEDCGVPFTPLRRKTVVRWCPACRPRGMKRVQQRRYRARKKAEGSGG